MSVEVDMGGLHRTIARLRDAAQDVRPAFEAWGDDVAADVAERFESKAWTPGADDTPVDLHATGVLRDSLTRPMAVDEVGEHTCEFGTDVFYARFLQRGARGRGARVLPARAFLSLTPELRRKLRNHIKAHLTSDA